MNIERLFRIIYEIQTELDKVDLVSKFKETMDHLQNQINQPQQPAHQTNFVNSLNQLYKLLDNSIINDFSPCWKQILEEIGGDKILGRALKQNLQSIISSNQITPASALEKIKNLFSLLENFKMAIDNTIAGLIELNIDVDIIDKGKCELGYLIPRSHVENKLSSLNKEISELSFILNTIPEAVLGEKQDFEVKTISSSDYLFYIIIGLSIANVLSNVFERIINNYKNILEIKVLRNQLKKKGVPDKDTKGIEEFANKSMGFEIKKIAHEIIKKYYKGEVGRKNELTNALIISFNKIANRIDKGFHIEIRVETLPEPKEGEKITKETKENINLINSIKERSRTLEYIKTDGKSILTLKEDNGKNKK